MPNKAPIRHTWPKLMVGDLLKRVVNPVKLEDGKVYQEIGIRSHCKGIFHKSPISGKKLGSKRVFWVEPDCLVFNIVFAWEHAIALTSDKEKGMIASHRFPMYTSADGVLLTEYAYLYFSSPRGKHVLGVASPGGAGRNKTLGQEEFKRLKIPVPPLEYQKSAIAVIRMWENAINQTESLLDLKSKLKRGLMKQLLTGLNRFEKYGKSTRSNKLPTGWERLQLPQIAQIIFSNVDKKSNRNEKHVKLCNYLDVYNNQHITSDLDFMKATATESEVKKYVLKAGDVIITKDSETPTDIAKAAVVIEDIPNILCGYHLAILRPKRRASGLFLGQLLMLPIVRYRFSRIANGATRFGLNLSSISQVSLWLPSYEEQIEIAKCLNKIDQEIKILIASAKNMREQRRGLVQKLLTGRVRVKV